MSILSTYFSLFVVLLQTSGVIKIGPDNTKSREIEGFGDIAEIVRVVRLEARPESVLNEIDKTVISPDGRIIVTESHSRQVLSFLPNGNYDKILVRQGGGPNEFSGDVIDLEVFPSGDVLVLTTHQMLRMDSTGKVLKRLNFRGGSGFSFGPQEFAVSNGNIFVQAARVYDGGLHEIYQFNIDLELVKTFHNFDQRKNKYLFIGWRHIQALDDRVFLAPLYEHNFFVYDTNDLSSPSLSLVFPDEHQSKLNALWSSKNFNEDTRTAIKTFTWRFTGFFPFGRGFLVFDGLRSEKRYRMLYLDQDMKVTQLHGYHLFYRGFNKEKAYTLYTIAGYHDGLTIGVLEYDDGFDEFKKQFPLLADVELTDLDNPLLVFFKPKKGW